MNALTEIEVPKKLAQSELIAGSRPRALVPTDLEQVWRLATIIHKANMAPKEFSVPEKIMVAIMHGLEIGLPPMMAMQRIAVINGRPAVWGDAVPAIAFATGQVEDFFESITGEGDKMVATCRLKRKGIKSQAERTFSVQDAKTAGLWEKGTVWKQYPKRMLQMRARIAFRDLFADALGGLYIAEELIGVETDESRSVKARDVTPQTVVRGGARSELPPELPAEDKTETETQAQAQAQADPKPEQTEAQTSARTGKPLPPLARTAPDDDDGIPSNLRRAAPPAERAAPPADEPEAFRAWIIAKLEATRSDEDIQLVWDSYIVPNLEADQIFPPDHVELVNLFADRRDSLKSK